MGNVVLAVVILVYTLVVLGLILGNEGDRDTYKSDSDSPWPG